MNPEIKAKWINALISGKYKQGVGALRTDMGEEGKGDLFCCLGVLCDVVAPEQWGVRYEHSSVFHDGASGALSDKIRENVGLSYEQEKALMAMNDEHGESFLEIAAFIEEKM